MYATSFSYLISFVSNLITAAILHSRFYLNWERQGRLEVASLNVWESINAISFWHLGEKN